MNRAWLAVVLTVLVSATGCKEKCATDDDCDDGLFCTGIERCRPEREDADRAGCVFTRTGACLAGDWCGEVGDRCIRPCGGFVTDDAGVVMTDTQGNPIHIRSDDRDGDGATDVECGGLDCNDLDSNTYRGNPEVCDDAGHDEDCDRDTWGARDQDGDGHLEDRCFHAGTDGLPEATGYDSNGVAYGFRAGTDCDDTNANVYPFAGEFCNGLDDNCDGRIDEGLLIELAVDADGDGYGRPNSQSPVCSTALGYSIWANDCDDANPQIRPGSIRCLTGGQGNEYELCQPNGGWLRGLCGQTCVTQPGAFGICR